MSAEASPFAPTDDDGRWPGPDEGAAPPRTRIRATPYVYRDPATIPPREWVYGRHMIRRFLSTTVAPGAVGKSSLVLVEAIAMVTGRPLLGIAPPRCLRVWYFNLEDGLEEIERRVAAICIHYGIDGRDLEGKLFLDSGRTTEVVIATKVRDGVKIAEPVIADLIAEMDEKAVDVLMVDPFVSSHRVTENANDEIDIVAKAWNRVAEASNVAIELVHHVRKGQPGQGEYAVEDGRGAGALLAAARSARVLNLMSKDQAEKAGVATNRGYFRVDNGKANLAPPPDNSDWYQLVSVALGNGPNGDPDGGDHIAVVAGWEWPDPFAGVETAGLRSAQTEVAIGGPWRENAQSPEWVGQRSLRPRTSAEALVADQGAIFGLHRPGTWARRGSGHGQDRTGAGLPATNRPLARAGRTMLNHQELNEVLSRRHREEAARKATELSPRLSLAAQTGSALAVLHAAQQAGKPIDYVPPLEASARARLQDAVNVRAGAREAVAAKETALAKAEGIERDAIAAEGLHAASELGGGNDLARRIVEHVERGGSEPNLAPDPASLEARHARDRARVHADAARQAVRALSDVLEAKRHALADAEAKVQAAARGVVEAVAEDIAIEGRKAGVIHRRAELAALALTQMTIGVAGSSPRYQIKFETAELAEKFTGPRRDEPANLINGAAATWQEFQSALESDPNAALG